MSRRDDDFEQRLAELEATLEDLRGQLRGAGPEPRLRPPTPREILQFTDRYTIPTLVAVLEANVRVLQLLRQLIRLSDPGRSVGADDGIGTDVSRERADALRREATDRLERTLSELRTALRETDLPNDPASRSIVEDARELGREIEERLEEGRRPRAGDEGVYGAADGSRAVEIEITDAADENGTDDATGGSDEGGVRGGNGGSDGKSARDRATDRPADRDADAPGDDVDVESELESIKDELSEESGEDRDEPGDRTDADGDSGGRG